MNINYDELSEITVKNQEELDTVPNDFGGRICIEFGTYFNPAIVKGRYKRSVVARGNSSVVARGNSSVVAWENSSVEARGNSSVVARGNSSVEAWENSSVVGRENAQIVDCLRGGKIEITGNARIVYNPKNIEEYMKFYGIKHTKKKGIFYKAVRKRNERYFSDRDSEFEYFIGKTAECKCGLDANIEKDCGSGIHLSHLAWCLDFGKSWDDLAILECEASLENVIVPLNCGKVRTDKVKVLREVPLEECGVYGKILAGRRRK